MTSNLIFILIIFSLLIHYFNKPKIQFLNKNDIQFHIIMDSDDYLKKLTSLDKKIRDCGNNEKSCINIYKNRLLNFNKDEMHYINFCVKKIHDQYVGPFSKEIKKIPWHFAKIDTNYENGLPHTRGTVIFLSDHTLQNKDWVYVSQTLLHEKIHIFQRLHKIETEDFIKNIGFRKISNFKEKIPDNFKNKIRSNPDVDNEYYGLNTEKGLIVPICIYKDNAKNLSDIKIKFLSKNGKVLSDSVSFYFKSRFPDTYQIEHPNEIMAEMISKKFYKPERKTSF
jgi:hypothetical protein